MMVVVKRTESNLKMKVYKRRGCDVERLKIFLKTITLKEHKVAIQSRFVSKQNPHEAKRVMSIQPSLRAETNKLFTMYIEKLDNVKKLRGEN